MRRDFFYFAIFLIFLLISNWTISATFDSDSTQVGLDVITSCGNGRCETNLGENENNCPQDCGCNHNGICELEREENSTNCPLDCPAALPPPPGGPPFQVVDTTPPVIFNLFISKITLNSAQVFWETNEAALCQLLWGLTQEYGEEVISEATFLSHHSTEINGLRPATSYHFKISCHDPNRNESETSDQKFTTLTPPDITPPANVANFKAVPGDKQITLSWENPTDLDFKGVKIIRSEEFYPINPWEEGVVYNNVGASFIDIGLRNGVRYYYTAFAYDKSGNYASGAITSAIPQAIVPPVVPPVVPPIIPPAPPEIEELTLKDFDFIQEGEKLPLIEEKIIKAKAEIPITISIASKKIPESFSILIITLEREQKSYLLRINREKTAYETTIVLSEENIYPFTISILNLKNQVVKKIEGKFRIEKVKITPPLISRYPKIIFWIIINILIIILLLILLIILLKRKKEEKEEKQKKTDGNK